jgi:hypothetical protein
MYTNGVGKLPRIYQAKGIFYNLYGMEKQACKTKGFLFGVNKGLETP